MPSNPSTAARNWDMAAARSEKTAANWALAPADDARTASEVARVACKLVCWTTLSNSDWRVVRHQVANVGGGGVRFIGNDRSLRGERAVQTGVIGSRLAGHPRQSADQNGGDHEGNGDEYGAPGP